ncbi:hypothetical protein N657DRAFT_576569 [Parathielavia appendiculata]|uniref:MutL C-terminal dimerisation domain-containing protein n=1 Tax=Parathielavia appendiculata TaxID=2587402 RepID=A0AAN6TX50_9PEZI|nr:hypothetical protein N657DRAFT_576569 [Parathielavia appendiculata]
MSIQPLPGNVAAQIRSSSTITSLNGTVCGLLQNSLDAGASRINISVDYSRGNCSVEDNGLGIAPASFRDDGGLGRLHYTSKYPPRHECHGKRGEFLACLAALSLLSIASHHRDYRTHNSLTIHNSRVVARCLPAPPEQRVLASTSGTRVVVRDLFGSMPVRVKQRATEVDRFGTAREFEQLIFNIVALLLPWPGEVVVSVRDSYARRTLFLSVSGAVDRSRSYQDIAPIFLSRVSTLLPQASIVENEDMESWVPIGATATRVSVRGCVSLRPAATKRVQFIAIGIQPLLNEHHSNLLYEDVNRVFENSSFGIVEEASLDPDDRPPKTQGLTGTELKPRRGIDRWPMFFLQIILSTRTDSIDLEEVLDQRQQTVAIITDLLQVMVYEFLKKHHLRPRSVTAVERLRKPKSSLPTPPSQSLGVSGPSTGGSGATVKRSRSRQDLSEPTSLPNSRGHASGKRSASPFASWSRTKSSLQQDRGTKDKLLFPAIPQQTGRFSLTSDMSSRTVHPLFDKSGGLLRKPFDDMDDVPATCENEIPDNPTRAAEPPAEKESVRETVVWVDPNTKIKSLIDPRTGVAVKPRTGDEDQPITKATRHQGPSNVSQLHQWRPNVGGEKTMIFQATEARIPQTLPASDTFCCDHGSINLEFQGIGGPAIQSSGNNLLATLEGRISKKALQKAEIVAQVDKKFILARVAAELPLGSTKHVTETDCMLILIDQHAADERCKVESLLQAYFGPDTAGGGQLVAQTQILDKPLRFDLSRQDGELLTRFRRHFAHWGITYEFPKLQEPGFQTGVMVEIQGLPPSILERCRLEPRLLINLLRKEIWKLHAAGSSGAMSSLRVDTGESWVARFHDCPEGILELINSRACRSAIMFNDPLTTQQCSDLVQRLASCAFPFQCAHGRPSMVPLVHLGQGSTLMRRAMEREGTDATGDLLGALKRWKRESR